MVWGLEPHPKHAFANCSQILSRMRFRLLPNYLVMPVFVEVGLCCLFCSQFTLLVTSFLECLQLYYSYNVITMSHSVYNLLYFVVRFVTANFSILLYIIICRNSCSVVVLTCHESYELAFLSYRIIRIRLSMNMHISVSDCYSLY